MANQNLIVIRQITIIALVVMSTLVSAQHINGITAVATPNAFPSDPYPRIKATNANWICLVPYGFTRKGSTDVWFNLEKQWWGERHDGVIENIRLAKENDLKVFLKPQVYLPGSWPGNLDFDTDEEWKKWEGEYSKFIMSFVEIAVTYDVDMFCIGTEFKVSETKRPAFWKKLIGEIRCLYSGALTYSSNWDSYQDVPFWEELDYIGISSYFPLSEEKTPSPYKLEESWGKIADALAKTSERTGKKIVFTEYGYLTVDGCAGKTWELEKKVRHLDINEVAQAKAFDGLYKTFWDKPFWAGGFIWKWFPHGQGHEGYVDRDYTPQDKEAETVIRKWFGQDM